MALHAKILFDDSNSNNMTDIIPDSTIYGDFRIKTKGSPLMLREKPNTDSKVICEMSNNRIVTCYGFTDTTGEWYLCEYGEQGRVVAGFCNKNYLIKG